MYEDKKFVKKKISWTNVFLKLLLLFLIVFLIWFVFFRKTNKKNDTKKGQTMTENLKDFKNDSIKYFTDEKLPKNIGEVKKVTLEQMIKDGATKKIVDKKGNECSQTSSYSQIVKTGEKSYDLKVYIKCKNEADSILTTIGNKKTTNTNNNNNNKNNNNNNNTNNNKNNNTKTNTKNSNSNKNTNTNTNNNSKSSSTSTKSTSTTNTTTTKTTTTNTNTNTNTNNTNTNNNSGNTTNNTNTNTNTQTTQYVPTEDKLLYVEYELIKYGDWTQTKPTSGSYKTDSIGINIYKYCWGNDYENCHKIAKTAKNMSQINYLLLQGYTELLDHTEIITAYLPYETIWSKTKDLPGYQFTGETRKVYRMN